MTLSSKTHEPWHYHLFYTLDLPLSPWRPGFDAESEVLSKIDWSKPYRQWLVPLDNLINPEFSRWLSSQGLVPIDQILFFGCQQGHQGYRHRDIHPWKPWHWWQSPYCSAALNFLLTPPAVGQLDFWDIKPGGDLISTETLSEYETGQASEEDHVIASWHGQDNGAPVLIRTEAAHQAVNARGPGPRVVATIRFKLNPHWWMARVALEDWFIQGY